MSDHEKKCLFGAITGSFLMAISSNSYLHPMVYFSGIGLGTVLGIVLSELKNRKAKEQ